MIKKRLLRAVVRNTVSGWKLLDTDEKRQQILDVTPYNYLDKYGMLEIALELGNKSLVLQMMGAYSKVGFVFKKEDELYTVELNNGVASFVPFEHEQTTVSILEYGNTLDELNHITSFAEEGSATLVVGCSARILPEVNVYMSSIEEVEIEDPTKPVNLNDGDRDFVVKGTAENGITVAASQSSTFNNVTMTSDSRLKANATDSITISNMTVEGSFTKSKGNAQQVINAEVINIDESNYNATGYNALEIGMSSKPRIINIRNIHFTGKLANNAISIFDTADNAQINIENCVFDDVSNPIRYSNKSNVHCNIFVTNCECKKWESNLAYTGLMLCQDYTSPSVEAVAENNLFSPEKIHITITNLKMPNGEVLHEPENMATICGSGTAEQVLYVYGDKGGNVAYSADRYPALVING